MSVRWQHFIDHADTKQKPANVTRLSSRRSSAADRQSVKRDYSAWGKKRSALILLPAMAALPQIRVETLIGFQANYEIKIK